jgi:hypothetical protein
MYNFDDGIFTGASGSVEAIVWSGIPAHRNTAVRECLVRASRGVRSAIGARRKWRAAIDGAGDADCGWKFECAVEEAGRGCVCVEEDRSGGNRRKAEGVGEISRGVGGDVGSGEPVVTCHSDMALRLRTSGRATFATQAKQSRRIPKKIAGNRRGIEEIEQV